MAVIAGTAIEGTWSISASVALGLRNLSRGLAGEFEKLADCRQSKQTTTSRRMSKCKTHFLSWVEGPVLHVLEGDVEHYG